MEDEQPKPKDRRGGKRAGAGQPRTSSLIPNANDIKRQFFSGDRLLELLNLELRMARNRPEETELITPSGEVVTIKRRPYDGRVAQAAASDLLDRGYGKAVQAIDLNADITIGAGLPEVRYVLNGVDLLPNIATAIDGQLALAAPDDDDSDGDDQQGN